MWAIPFALTLALYMTSTFVHGENTVTQIPDPEAEWLSLWQYSLVGRIVNGTKAEMRQFPYQVSLRRSYNSRHFCGASLIHTKYVLTAAHCVVDGGSLIQPWTVMVVGGGVRLSDNGPTVQKRGVEKIYAHPQFDGSTLYNDVAVIKLKVPFTLSMEIYVIPLSTHTPVPNTMCQVSGWGYPSEEVHEVTDNLMYVSLPLLSHARCKELLANATDFPPGMLCAGYEEGQMDACQGDSGGGMTCNNMLTGIVSGGNGCARPASPGVYTDVYFYKDWISNIVEDSESKVLPNSTTTVMYSLLMLLVFTSAALYV